MALLQSTLGHRAHPVWATLAFLIPLGMIAAGASRAFDQDRQIRRALPTEAIVESSQVQTRTTGSGKNRRTVHEPIIHYSYRVSGQSYVGSRVTPLNDVTQLGRARALVTAHPPGARAKAYYQPDDPGRAFLVPHYSFEPYFLCHIGAGVSGVLLLIGVGGLFRGASPVPGAAAGGWVRLTLRDSLRSRFHRNVVRGVVHLGIIAAVTWHYLSRAPGPHGTASWLAPLLASLPGVWWLLAAGRARSTTKAVSDARVMVDALPVTVGRPIRIRVEQDLVGQIRVEELRVGLRCLCTTRSGKNMSTRTCWEAWHTEQNPPADRPGGAATLQARLARAAAATAEPVGALRTIAVETALTIPAGQPPSSPHRASGFPRYGWWLVVQTKLPGCADYRADYEVTAQSPEPS